MCKCRFEIIDGKEMFVYHSASEPDWTKGWQLTDEVFSNPDLTPEQRKEADQCLNQTSNPR